jgi:hypothetical protein
MSKIICGDNQILSKNIRKEHNKKGKQSTIIGGYGSISEKGYRRIWDTNQKRLRFEHDMVWEFFNGNIPERFDIHHKDGNKLNNSIENLELSIKLNHKRIHSGCKFINGESYKPCKNVANLKKLNFIINEKMGFHLGVKNVV